MTFFTKAIKLNPFCFDKRILSICHLALITFSQLFFGSINSHAVNHPDNLQFRYITTDNGLSSSLVLSFLQDHKGYMWIGTYNGLNRYDGKTIKVYKNDASDPNSLQCDHIRDIFEENNNLYIGTNCGLSYYNPESDNFINYMNDESSSLYGLGVSVYGINSDKNGNLWLATDSGLVHFNPINQSTAIYAHNPKDANSLPNNLVQNVFTDSKNRTWVSMQGGLALFDPETEKFEVITDGVNPANVNSQNTFLQTAEDLDGNIWFASFDGLFCLNSSSSDNHDLICYRNTTNSLNSISNNHLTSLYVDNQNNLWIGAENDGLYLFNREQNNFSHFSTDDFNPKSLNNKSIQAINVDRSGNLWIGTYGGGINLSPKNSDAILYYKHIKGTSESLSNNVVSAFYEDSKSRIWIATDGGGLNLFNKKTTRFTCYDKSNAGFSSNAILSIEEDNAQNLWLGTWNGGIIKFDPNTQIPTHYTIQNSKIPDNSIFSVVKGENNDLWLGSYRSGLIHFDIDNNEFHSFNPLNSSIVSEYVFVLKKYNKDQLILGTTNGFSIFSTKTETFTNYPFEQDDQMSISHNFVYDIAVENDTSIWIGTQSGLNRFNPKTKTIKKYYEEDGLPNNVIRSLVFDQQGYLWVTTTSGICRLDCNNQKSAHSKCKIFTKDDGLQGSEFNYRSTLLSGNGKLYLGGMNGFNVISTDKLIENTHIPELVITELEIFNKPVVPNTPGSPLKQIISETSKITLDYKQTVLTFSFAAMDFTSPEKNQYAYKLENFDKEWTYSGNRSKVTYTNLDPGDYILKVKAANNDGIWNEKATALQIEILPPWYLTVWVKILTLFFVVGIIILFFYIRTATLRKQKRLLEREVRERTADLNEKNLLLVKKSDELSKINIQLVENQKIIEDQSEELRATAENLEEMNNELSTINATKDKLFSVIAHDLKNPFNVILGFSELLLSNFETWDDKEKHRILTFLNNSANEAFTLLENLLHWSRSQGKTIVFAPSEINVANFVEEMLANVSAVANNKNVETVNLCANKNLMVNADQNLLTIICHNLLTNAIKFSFPDSKIFINAESYGEDFVRFSISDEGVGMSKEKAESLFKLESTSSTKGTEGEKGTGLGLMLCKEFVNYHNGQIWLKSQVNQGTTFFFTIPK